LKFLGKSSKNSQISGFMRIPSGGPDFHAVKLTDG